MCQRLKDKVALIFGAGASSPGWGNGNATAVIFARQGAKVIAVDRSVEAARATADIIVGEGGSCRAVAADVTITADVKRAVEICMAEHDRIDILQNNVGVTHLGGPVELSDEAWNHSMQVNVGYMFQACKHVLPIMEAQGAGAIVNVSSIASVRWTGRPWIGYATFKAAVNQFTQAVAMQYARSGIRANVVMPGRMYTPMVRDQLSSLYADQDDLRASIEATCPTGKMGDGWDVAYASLFLASDEAKYVTGAILPVDGGVTACA
jgi:NAD(P)-dependent dehydrogenase (short-subunit alcohol dehydrogenase family)